MKKTYHHIVFLQGHEADETLQIINENGCEAAVHHLLQWDNGEYYEQRDTPSAGSGDYTYTSECGDYLLTYNPRIGYAGLEYVETDGPYPKDPEEKYWDACQTWAERRSHEDEDLW
jgi:hypothetical protein